MYTYCVRRHSELVGLTRGLTRRPNDAAMLEVHFVWTRRKLKCRNRKKKLNHGSLLTVYFDWYKIPHTAVCKFTTLHCCNMVYLQHGGGNYRRQNDALSFHENNYRWQGWNNNAKVYRTLPLYHNTSSSTLNNLNIRFSNDAVKNLLYGVYMCQLIVHTC